MSSKTAIIIPARYQSSRYPGKPLAELKGASGRAKTLLHRSIEAARATGGGMGVHVATDDARIAEEARRQDTSVIMTSASCRNGTERVAQAMEVAGLDVDIVVNLQGDAPLTPPWFLTALIDHMTAVPDCPVATPVLRCDRESLESFLADRRAGRVGATTVVRALDGSALYFSKEVIPFTGGRVPVGEIPVFHHVGVYAYRRAALASYMAAEPTPLERLEGLEQLRFLELGVPIRAVEVEAGGRAFWELNNPEDRPLIEAYLKRMGVD